MGKSITTYLIDGTPKEVQIVGISNRTMIVYNNPYTRIDILRGDERKELRTLALVNHYTLDDNVQNPVNPTLTESRLSADDEYSEENCFAWISDSDRKKARTLNKLYRNKEEL